jgi:alkaline phosphatase D
MNPFKSLSLLLLFLLTFVFACNRTPDTGSSAHGFRSDWPTQTQRSWIGPEYWANRLQDWQIKDGRLECLVSAENRNVHVLTHQLSDQPHPFSVRVTVGSLAPAAPEKSGWAGFMVGAKGEFSDYRDNAVHGKGLHAGLLTSGRLFIGKMEEAQDAEATLSAPLGGEGVEMRLAAEPTGSTYTLTLSAHESGSGKQLGQIKKEGIAAEELAGNLALVSDFPKNAAAAPAQGGQEAPSFWFCDWRIEGDKVLAFADQTFGPIMWSQYTLSNGLLKLSAQMAPVGKDDAQVVRLQTQPGGSGAWQTVAEAPIDPLARTATFRIEGWQDDQDTPYRLVYEALGPENKQQEHYWQGTVRKDPMDKQEVVVAAFTGNNDVGFPHNEIVRHVTTHQPDLLVFTGDQIYESVAGYGVQRAPLEKATLDYLRKWYLYGWEFRELLKDIPSVAIPDDHDVYQGNVWGAGGKAASKEGDQKDQQDSGGFTMPAEWVNMVQRTQTSHLPDPYDPTPAAQGVSVYYCDLQVGGISFAVLEDRKWKTPPKSVLPARLKVKNGWAEASRHVDPKVLDVPAQLLGERQQKFLREWAADWPEKVWSKSVISQTIFATIATLPDSAVSDVVVPTLRITKKEEYPAGDIPTQDMDSNSWPRQGRNEALREIRKAFAFHIAGDQHLGSTLQYGIDEFGDAGYALCVPSVNNFFPRRWFPTEAGKNRKPGAPKNTGDYHDGFGNKMTVLAVSNPYYTGLQPARLYDRAAGYGIVKFNRDSREIEIANWARQTDPTQPGARPYDGWPITISQEDNYGRQAYGYLPQVDVSGLGQPPVVQVIDESNQEILYTVRAKDNSYRPKVFKPGRYTVRVGEPATGQVKTMTGLVVGKGAAAQKPVAVTF